ncbi:unnamed protein product [Arabis nemorensis]|uniref:Uncharacterized protein n=1 Tax=Arabis nemorensis TaxID=586526 RepID=A0A565CJH4_9BRAS|nr:unnamed protein product [Arabis nemorensis]
MGNKSRSGVLYAALAQSEGLEGSRHVVAVTHFQSYKREKCSAARRTKVDGMEMSKHVSGQISFEEQARRIAHEKGAPATMPELWEKTHKRNDGTWVDRRVQKLHGDVTARVEEIRWYTRRLVPRTREGKMTFTGSIPIDEEGVPYCPISSYASDPIRDKKLELAEQEIKSLKEDNRVLKEDSNSFNEIFVIGATNPAIAEMMQKKREATTTRGEGTSETLTNFVSRLFDMNSH